MAKGPCGKVIGKGCKCKKGAGVSEPSGGMKEVRSYPLSDGDIRHILGDDITILTNRQLEDLNSPDEMFDSQGRCVLLYTPEDPTSGHWVCIIKQPDHIFYFDPYGDKPDDKQELNGQEPILTQLLKQTGMPVYYNTHQYQKLRGDVATCGRWVCTRLIYKDTTPQQFMNVVKKFKGEPDDFVSGLIYSFLNK